MQKGFELDAYLRYVQPVLYSQALQTVEQWQPREWFHYGEGAYVRAIQLRANLSPQEVRVLLQQGFQLQLWRSVEIGFRGFLLEHQRYEHVPWIRNCCKPRSEVPYLALEQGVRYLVE